MTKNTRGFNDRAAMLNFINEKAHTPVKWVKREDGKKYPRPTTMQIAFLNAKPMKG